MLASLFWVVFLMFAVIVISKQMGNIVTLGLVAGFVYGLYLGAVWLCNWVSNAYDTAMLAIGHTYVTVLHAVGF